MNVADLLRAPRQVLTPRLRLETPRLDHAPAVMASINASLPDLAFVRWGQHAVDRVWADAFSQRNTEIVASGQALIYYAIHRETGAFVGNLDLHSFDVDVPRCEIGYSGDSRHAGRGLMREAALAMIELAFGLGVLRIEAMSDTRNLRAIRFALQLGFTQEGVMRCHERDETGALCDQVLLSRLHPSLASDPSPLTALD